MEAKWFIDEDGEFGLFVNGEYLVFHKWSDPVQCDYSSNDVTFLNDGNAKPLWRKFSEAISEYKQEEAFLNE